MSELEQIAGLFEQLGASRAQATVMAAQVLRRADQLAAERGITREEALRKLLEVVVRGRAGETPGGSSPAAPDSGASQ